MYVVYPSTQHKTTEANVEQCIGVMSLKIGVYLLGKNLHCKDFDFEATTEFL